MSGSGAGESGGSSEKPPESFMYAVGYRAMAVTSVFHSRKSGWVVVDSGDANGRRRFGLHRWSGSVRIGHRGE